MPKVLYHELVCHSVIYFLKGREHVARFGSEVNLLVEVDILADTTKFTLQTDASCVVCRVVARPLVRPERRAALRSGVVMVVVEVACSVIRPSTNCIDKARRIKRPNVVCQSELRPRRTGRLSPFFIVDCLDEY